MKCYLVMHVPVANARGPKFEGATAIDSAISFPHVFRTNNVCFKLWAAYTFAITFISIAIGDGRAFIETVVLAGIISPKCSAYTSL